MSNIQHKSHNGRRIVTASNTSRHRAPRRSESLNNSPTASPHVLAGLAVMLVGLIWTVGVAVLSVRLGNQHPSNTAASRVLFADQPLSSLMLWPDDNKNPGLELLDCLPKKNENCLQRVDAHSSIQRIGVIRPPSVLGDTMASLVNEYLKLQKSSQGKFEAEQTSHIDSNHYYTKIVRIAVLPLYLEAIDLLLQTGATSISDSKNNNKHNSVGITVNMILDVVQVLLQWHCRLSSIAHDTALLTLTMDPAMAFPLHAETVLGDFLGYAPAADDDASNNHIHSDQLAEQALGRIDACRHVLQTLVDKNPSLNIEALVDDLLRKHDGASCDDMALSVLPDENNKTYIIQQFLDTNPDSSISVCQLYSQDNLPICKHLNSKDSITTKG